MEELYSKICEMIDYYFDNQTNKNWIKIYESINDDVVVVRYIYRDSKICDKYELFFNMKLKKIKLRLSKSFKSQKYIIDIQSIEDFKLSSGVNYQIFEYFYKNKK